MQALMKISDFRALCPKPHPVTAHVRGLAIPVVSFSGMGTANIRRVIEDWFPEGAEFEFLGMRCRSKGVFAGDGFGQGNCHLRVASYGVRGEVETHWSVRQVLSAARQISVDRCNALAELA